MTTRHLTTNTPAGRAERMRWWILNGIAPLDKKTVLIAGSLGITLDEVIALGEVRLAKLEAKAEDDKAARATLVNMKARSGAY